MCKWEGSGDSGDTWHTFEFIVREVKIVATSARRIDEAGFFLTNDIHDQRRIWNIDRPKYSWCGSWIRDLALHFCCDIRYQGGRENN